MIASLPMYDWPEIRAATDAWWRGLAGHAGLSLSLARTADYTSAWRSPELLFGQTCGYPFTHEFKGKLTYIATPHYAAEGCEGAFYRSIVFAREGRPFESFRGGTATINGTDSMSGMLALKLVAAQHAASGRFFSRHVISGSHRQSLALVQAGKADVCAIDCVCVELARHYAPDNLKGLVEIARSPLVPALPYVTRQLQPEKWQAAVAAAFADPQLADARRSLLLQGYSILAPAAYDTIPSLEAALGAETLLGQPAQGL